MTRSDSGCLNVDLDGVLELLRKSKKLKKVVFRDVISSGIQLPSDYIKEKLTEQRDDFQLRKYIVKKPISPYRIKKMECYFEVI